MNVLLRALFVGLLVFGQNLFAVEVQHLYETEVIARSEKPQDKEIAVEQALHIVLRRILSGQESLQSPAVKEIMTNAMGYVEEYQYSLVEAEATSIPGGRLMRVLFNEQLLVDVLRKSAVGVWNEIRPRTLVWLIVEKEGRQHFFDAGLMPEVDLALNGAARQMGLPILFPIQDLSEAQSLSISDVLSAYSKHLLAVSTRYEVVSTVAGKMVKKRDCWEAEWTLYFDNKIEQWSSACSSIRQAALVGFQGVYDRLSGFYSVKPELNSLGFVVLKISNISKEKDLKTVTKFLEALSAIETVTWTGVESGYNVFRIFFRGNRSDFNESLKSQSLLRAEMVFKRDAEQLKYHYMAE